MQVKLIDYNTGGLQTAIDALSICRDKQCDLDTLDHCLTAKPVPHLSALEFTWFCFLVTGMSIKTRLQLAQHRHFSTMERSTRHINMIDAEMVNPTAMPQKLWEWYLFSRYDEAIDEGLHLEDAAYLLPLATPTTFHIAGNGRVWYEYLQKRLCTKHVQAEHNQFATDIYKQLVKVMPWFKYAFPCRECDGCKGKACD